MAISVNGGSLNQQFYSFVKRKIENEAIELAYPILFKNDIKRSVHCSDCEKEQEVDSALSLSEGDEGGFTEVSDGLTWNRLDLRGGKLIIEKINEVKNFILSEEFKRDPLQYCSTHRYTNSFVDDVLQKIAIKSPIYEKFYVDQYVSTLEEHLPKILENVFPEESLDDIEVVEQFLKVKIKTESFFEDVAAHIDPHDNNCGCSVVWNGRLKKLDQKQRGFIELNKYLHGQSFDYETLIQSLPYYTILDLKNENEEKQKPSSPPANSD